MLSTSCGRNVDQKQLHASKYQSSYISKEWVDEVSDSDGGRDNGGVGVGSRGLDGGAGSLGGVLATVGAIVAAGAFLTDMVVDLCGGISA